MPDKLSLGLVVTSAVCLLLCCASVTSAQERRGLVFGQAGFASIGHADSEQGKAPIVGLGGSLQLAPWLLVEGDVHHARISNVFGDDNHSFAETTLTGSLLYRAFRNRRVRLVAGGGLGVQRARSMFAVASTGQIDVRETIRLWHGLVGGEWSVADRVVIRTDSVWSFGDGLDWVVGGIMLVGYRF